MVVSPLLKFGNFEGYTRPTFLGRLEFTERMIRYFGCWRCIPACPQGAIKLEIDSQEGDMIEALLDRIATRVDITGMR
jgi:ferredoxin